MTTFDEKRRDAKRYLREAIESLNECVNPNTFGCEEMTQEFLDGLVEAMNHLLLAERKL